MSKKLPDWVEVAPDCNPILRDVVEAAIGEDVTVTALPGICLTCGTELPTDTSPCKC